MKKLFLTAIMIVLSLNSFAEEILSESRFVGEKDGFFGGQCELVIQEVETINRYGQGAINLNIVITSGDKEFRFLASKNAYQPGFLDAISGSDFFLSRPTQLKIKLDNDQRPVSLLITKEKFGNNKLLSCSDFY